MIARESDVEKTNYLIKIKKGVCILEIKPFDSFNLRLGRWEISVLDLLLKDPKEAPVLKPLLVTSGNCGKFGNEGIITSFFLKFNESKSKKQLIFRPVKNFVSINRVINDELKINIFDENKQIIDLDCDILIQLRQYYYG